MSKRVHFKASFQEKWIDNIKCKTWLAQAPSGKSTARCILRKKGINISIMGVSALESQQLERGIQICLMREKSIKMYFSF